MTRLALSDAERRDAMAFYQTGKAPDFEVERMLADLGRWLVKEPELVTLFLETQLWAAYADQQLNDTDRRLLKALCRHLKIGARQFNGLHRQIRAQREREARLNPGLSNMTLAEAYQLLGVTAGDSDAAIKQACRRAMSKNHPDKLMAQGPGPAGVDAEAGDGKNASTANGSCAYPPGSRVALSDQFTMRTSSRPAMVLRNQPQVRRVTTCGPLRRAVAQACSCTCVISVSPARLTAARRCWAA